MISGRASAPGGAGKSLFDFTLGQEPGWRLLLLLGMTSVLFVLGTAAVATAAWLSVPPRVFTEAFYAQYCVPGVFFYAGQPAKNAAYLVTCAAVPLLLPAAYFAARSIVSRIPASRLPFYLRPLVIVFLVFFAWCVSALGFTKVPALEGMTPDWLSYKWFFITQPFLTVTRFVCIAGALGLGCFFFGRPSTASNRNGAAACLVGIYLLLLPFDFYAPSEINEGWLFDNHFNPLVYALGQVIDGHHFLVDFPHMYGGYVEFLAPILALAPHRPETIVLAFGFLKAASLLALIFTARLLIGSTFHLVLTGCSLMGTLCIQVSDNYYQTTAVRIFFPAIGLCAAVLYLRSSRREFYVLTSLLAAAASVWNLDTGLVLWLSWTLTLIARDWSEGRVRRLPANLLAQAILLVTAWTAFWIHLRISTGRWPAAATLFAFQGVYAGSGFLCVRLLVPDAWLIVLAIYAVALATATVFYLRRKPSWKIHALLLMALMGIGLFAYFLGRSCDSNLVGISWPIPFILGLLLSEARSLMASGQLPRAALAVALPALLVQLWWALLFALAIPNMVEQSVARFETWQLPSTTTHFTQNAAFVQSQTHRHERLLILSNQGGFYHYLSDTVDATGLPSTDEWLFTAQVDALLASLNARQIPKLIIDQDFFDVEIYNHDIYPRIHRAVAQNYRLAITSPTGDLKLYVPTDANGDGPAH
jgi:hypothetical protein